MLKRLDPWKGMFIISSGKLILTNACLTNLPMYMMGFYMLPIQIFLAGSWWSVQISYGQMDYAVQTENP